MLRKVLLLIPLDTFKAVNAQYVRVSAIKPTQNSDTAVRIYEIEVKGLQ